MNRSSVSQAGVAARRDLYALPSTQARPVRRPFA